MIYAWCEVVSLEKLFTWLWMLIEGKLAHIAYNNEIGIIIVKNGVIHGWSKHI